MKKINILILLLLLLLTPGILISQTYDLQFVEMLNNGTNYNVKIQIKASSPFRLAASNITFNFNDAGLSNPILELAHNFSGVSAIPYLTIYGAMTVTTPTNGVASINIFFTQGDETYAATVGTSWIDVATVGFTTINPSLLSNLTFRSAEPANTVVYVGSGVPPAPFVATLLTPGTWTPLNNPLPVELSSFTGKVVDGSEVKLNWNTKTETNNYGFNVERRTVDEEWKKIGFVEGNGNSNSPKNYNFTDKDLFAGGSKFEYRLKQIDNDGAFEYSDIVEVTVMPTEYELSQNYPNPFNPSTTIRFSLPTETRLKINIYNMLGQLVETLAEGNFEAGYHKVTFNASTLPSGAYIYRIESNDFTQVRKMVLIK